MNDEMKFAGYGAYLFGALFLAGVFILAVSQNNTSAALWSIAGAGAAYIAQVSTAFRIAGAISAAVSLSLWAAAVLVAAIAAFQLV